MKTLLRIIYTSRACIPFDEAGLQALLEKSRRNNYGKGITGALSFGNGFFLQVLEGPEQDLVRLYATILADPRHRDCSILDIGFTRDRMFPNWTMAFSGDIGRIGGHYNEMLDYRIVREDPEQTRALLKSLLEIVTE